MLPKNTLKSIANTTDSNTNTAILTTLGQSSCVIKYRRYKQVPQLSHKRLQGVSVLAKYVAVLFYFWGPNWMYSLGVVHKGCPQQRGREFWLRCG